MAGQQKMATVHPAILERYEDEQGQGPRGQNPAVQGVLEGLQTYQEHAEPAVIAQPQYQAFRAPMGHTTAPMKQASAKYTAMARQNQINQAYMEMVAMGKQGARMFIQDAVRVYGPGIASYLPPLEPFIDPQSGQLKAHDWYKSAYVGLQHFEKSQANLRKESREHEDRSRAEKGREVLGSIQIPEGATREEAYRAMSPAVGYAPKEDIETMAQGYESAAARTKRLTPPRQPRQPAKTDPLVTAQQQIDKVEDNLARVETSLISVMREIKNANAARETNDPFATKPTEADVMALQKQRIQLEGQRRRYQQRLKELEQTAREAEKKSTSDYGAAARDARRKRQQEIDRQARELLEYDRAQPPVVEAAIGEPADDQPLERPPARGWPQSAAAKGKMAKQAHERGYEPEAAAQAVGRYNMPKATPSRGALRAQFTAEQIRQIEQRAIAELKRIGKPTTRQYIDSAVDNLIQQLTGASKR